VQQRLLHLAPWLQDYCSQQLHQRTQRCSRQPPVRQLLLLLLSLLLGQQLHQ
jgi:hypothetical protein